MKVQPATNQVKQFILNCANTSKFIVEDIMKPYTLLAFMVVAITATVSNHETSPRLNEVLTKAENEMQSNLMRKMMNGAKSSRSYRKKFTAM